MRFLSRMMSLVSEGSHARPTRSAAGRRPLRMELEPLEGRALLSALAGVSVQYGNLAIQAPQASGNVAVITAPAPNTVQLSLNGQCETFNTTQISITSITYLGGSGGGDTMVNDTDLPTVEYGFGSGNNFMGGTGFNYAFFFGGANTFDAQAGSVSDVFELSGGNTVSNPDGAVVQDYVY